MSIGVFIDKGHQPTNAEIFKAIDPMQAAWRELMQFIRENYTHQEEFKFYGKNYGWAMRCRKSGKALVSLYPTEGGFTIQIILNETDIENVLRLKLGKHIQHIITVAHPYSEGRWLFIPIKTEKDIRDIRQLLILKGGQAKRRKRVRLI